MRLVSFYFDPSGNFYENCSKELIKQCKEFDIPYIIKNVNFGNTWIDNVRGKALFLKDILNHATEDLIWLDIDCKILKKPDFKMEEWGVDFREDGTPHDYVHYIPNKVSSRMFVDTWICEIERLKGGSHSAFVNLSPLLNPVKIPNGYFELGLSETDSKKEYFSK